MTRQVFPEENPSVTVPASEAKAAEDIPAASAEEEERREERERVATPPATHQVILEGNVIVPDPPVLHRTEVENTEAATNTATNANDVVMAEDNVEPEANVVHCECRSHCSTSQASQN